MKSQKTEIQRLALVMGPFLLIALAAMLLIVHLTEVRGYRPPAGRLIPETHYLQAPSLSARVAALEAQVAELKKGGSR